MTDDEILDAASALLVSRKVSSLGYELFMTNPPHHGPGPEHPCGLTTTSGRRVLALTMSRAFAELANDVVCPKCKQGRHVMTTCWEETPNHRCRACDYRWKP